MGSGVNEDSESRSSTEEKNRRTLSGDYRHGRAADEVQRRRGASTLTLRAILYYNPGADLNEESGRGCVGLVARSAAREREKGIAGSGIDDGVGGGGLSGRLAPRIKVL